MNCLSRSSVLQRVGVVALILLLVYVGSYDILSRRGLAQSKAAGFTGLYFFPPEDTNSWRLCNYGCVTFYYPLIVVEMWLGTMNGIGCEPMWKLSGADGSGR